MTPMRFFVDTHDRSLGTFREKMSTEEFEAFFAKYEQACYEEGVVVLRLHLSLEEGRVFCFNMAPDAVGRAGVDPFVQTGKAAPKFPSFKRVRMVWAR